MIYAFLYIIIMKIMKRTGRITPVWGFSSLISYFLINEIIILLLLFTNKFYFIDDGYMDKMETLLILYSSLLSFILTIFIFYFLSLFLKKKTWRNELKNTKINYNYVGFIITLLSIYMMIDIYQFMDKSGIFGSVSLFVQGILTIVVVTYCFRYQKLVTQTKEELKKVPNVLLLRSFEQAKKPSRNLPYDIINKLGDYNILEHVIFGYTLDQAISVYLNEHIGHTIALGDPNDYLPEAGATKKYISDMKWWDEAAELISKVKLNIVFESEGEGTKKEIEYIRNNLSSSKIILITYPSSYNIDIWNEFYKICSQSGLNIPVEYPGNGVVISFDKHWNYVQSLPFDHDLYNMVKYIKKLN